jgi:hypothetical protein
MSTHVMSTIASKVLNGCCGDRLDDLCAKLPFHKPNSSSSNHIEEDVDATPVAEEKKEDAPSEPVVTKPNRFGAASITPFDMKYELTQWKDLPADVQKAAQDVLEYDEEMWNNGEYVDVDGKHWEDLSEEELQAVQLLGWDEDTWEHKYEHTEWTELPDVIKRAAESAGYTEEIWENSEHPLEEKYWEEMSDEEKVALTVFGWTQTKWDG